MTEKQPAVYILASGPRGTLYIGVTSDLVKRIWQHREGMVDGFSDRYGVKRLVWYEIHRDMMSAITARSCSRNGIGSEDTPYRGGELGLAGFVARHRPLKSKWIPAFAGMTIWHYQGKRWNPLS